jgi:hypothetical protein
MSRALGAAFLNHQVTELERNTNNQRTRAPRGRGGRTGGGVRRSEKDQEYDPEFDRARTKADFGIGPTAGDEGSWRRRPQSSDDTASESASPPRPRTLHGAQGARSAPPPDVVVVDASVLIHSLGAVQRWCRNKHTQVVIPLEGELSPQFCDRPTHMTSGLKLLIPWTSSNRAPASSPYAPGPPPACSRRKLE